ncbi:hypothetical protein QF023_002142 [Chryseobacterium sp. SLBN-27]|uniref:hypothetical protein n=1 Tax=Chryseobacterium sp. SLBN-27 TaxID=3042287 RepID=UPI00285D990D|nr:hypothetical protein [Chryseobacterium sp. SLBN-27]MDR6158626.1 hypothetical protein [Chryseobacterium sp. SLBN-27]
MEDLRQQILDALFKKKSDWKEKVYDSQQYHQQIKYVSDITKDFVDIIRAISIYSTRGGEIYENFLCIRASDDMIQSAIGIQMLADNGIHNSIRRELRYLIEMITKYVIVDYDKKGKKLAEKLDYLNDEIPNSSIEIVTKYSTPFKEPMATEFRNEIKDFFYKSCAYVHPSKKQLDEQLTNYENGFTIGFESAVMFSNLNKTIFRAYDMILTMCLHSFGYSMSKDLFEQIFNEKAKWKFHKGKFVNLFKNELFK